MRRTVLFALFILTSVALSIQRSPAQGNTLVELADPLPSRTVAGVVTDPAGFVMPDVKVEEMSGDWSSVLRSSKTDKTGTFRMTPVRGRALYHLQFTTPGFNQLRLKLLLDKKGEPQIKVILFVGT